MEVTVLKPVVGVADVRRTPLGQLAQVASSTPDLCRVLPGFSAEPVSLATFNSSI